LKRFPILLVGRIFNGDGVVTFADFTVFFGFALLWNIYKLRRGSWCRAYTPGTHARKEEE
jgi:hypothetical protein